jgi:hypothetical protein
VYPDERDILLVTQKLGVAADAEKIWPDVARARAFLNFAAHCCHNHGKHSYSPEAELKTLTERWIGHAVDMTAFRLGAYLANVRFAGKAKISSARALNMKFPPCGRLEEYRQAWSQEQRSVERDIEEEQRRKPF